MKNYFCILIFCLSISAPAAENCGGASTESALDSMATKYKGVIGNTLVLSELDEEWVEFSSFPVRTGKLEDILFDFVLDIYPYEEEGWTPDNLRPYLIDNFSRPVEEILEYFSNDSERRAYRNLEKTMLKDVSRVWGVWVGMETIEDSEPIGLGVIFLVGQTACGHWVGLRAFTLST